MILIDLVGKKFGRWTVLSFCCQDKNKNSRWKCICECGNEALVLRGSLVSGSSKSCGCFNSVNYTIGEKVGRCIYNGNEIKDKKGRRKAQFVCHCGKLFTATISDVKTENTKSCGCAYIHHTKYGSIKHGMRYTPENKTWKEIKQRCNNPNSHKYPIYGGRGIKVCERWMHSFENFFPIWEKGRLQATVLIVIPTTTEIMSRVIADGQLG